MIFVVRLQISKTSAQAPDQSSIWRSLYLDGRDICQNQKLAAARILLGPVLQVKLAVWSQLRRL